MPPVNNPTLHFSFDLNAVNVILAGLSELPAKHSRDLIAAIEHSATAQVEAQRNTETVEHKPALSDPLG
jgi:hypothetical protein